jgi:hypothetical protein
VNSRDMLRAHILVLIALSLVGCGGSEKRLSVSEVWQNADSLDGKRIRVRGQADFQLIPYHPMQVGGCIPSTEGEIKPRIVGELALLDQDSHDPKHRLSISESSLQCEGDVCNVVCKPFAPSAQAIWGGTETIEAFEFVGTLRVRAQESKGALILDDIDLRVSRRLADGEWGPIPRGDFTYNFP